MLAHKICFWGYPFGSVSKLSLIFNFAVPVLWSEMTTVAASVGMNAHGGMMNVRDGNKTQVVYTLLRDGKCQEAVTFLNTELQNHPKSRAALSLLAYAYYYLQDFASAAQTYETLNKYHPGVEQYKVYYAQALYKASQYEEATKATLRVDDDQFAYRMLHLQAAIHYEQDDLPGTKSFVEQCMSDDHDTVVANGSILFAL